MCTLSGRHLVLWEQRGGYGKSCLWLKKEACSLSEPYYEGWAKSFQVEKGRKGAIKMEQVESVYTRL